MSAAASAAESTTTNESAQTSVQGASGAESPTITAGNNVTYNSDGGAVTETAINDVAAVVQQALAGAGQVVAQSSTAVQQQAQNQSSNDSALLLQTLANEQQLASNQGTPASVQNDTLVKYAIFGAIGVAALGVLAFIFTRPK